MANDALITVMVKPLGNTMLEEPLPENVSHEPGDVALSLIGELTGDREDPLGAARTRHRHASDDCDEPDFVPMHPVIMDHVVRPLREAKQCYVLGMPVACIAQAGLVGEMVALWRFRMLSSTVDGKPLDERMQKLLMGRVFDKLSQQDRVRVLQALDSIDDELVKTFGDLREIRRQYLHFMVDENQNPDADALQALRLANKLVVKTLGVKFNQGVLVLPENVTRFVRDLFHSETDRPRHSREPEEESD